MLPGSNLDAFISAQVVKKLSTVWRNNVNLGLAFMITPVLIKDFMIYFL